MVEKVKRQIRLYVLCNEVGVALSQIHRIIDWVHFSSEMGIISFEEWKDLIDYAIDVKIILQKKGGIKNEAERDCKASEL